jgi:hypothetical protein
MVLLVAVAAAATGTSLHTSSFRNSFSTFSTPQKTKQHNFTYPWTTYCILPFAGTIITTPICQSSFQKTFPINCFDMWGQLISSLIVRNIEAYDCSRRKFLSIVCWLTTFRAAVSSTLSYYLFINILLLFHKPLMFAPSMREKWLVRSGPSGLSRRIPSSRLTWTFTIDPIIPSFNLHLLMTT